MWTPGGDATPGSRWTPGSRKVFNDPAGEKFTLTQKRRFVEAAHAGPKSGWETEPRSGFRQISPGIQAFRGFCLQLG
jgi:hypothetical protein